MNLNITKLFAILSLFVSASATTFAQTQKGEDVTSRIINAGFENGLDGWSAEMSYDTFAIGNASDDAFSGTVGNKYAYAVNNASEK